MLIGTRRRTILVAALAGACLAALGVTATSSYSARQASGSPIDLPVSNLNTPAGTLTKLRAQAAYQATGFPIAVRITPPDTSWGGSQWKTSSRGKPAFGWAGVGQGPLDKPRGLIEIETAFGATLSVPAILARFRSAGGGATFGPTKRITLAGFPGWQIDGKVFGRFGHVFVPFTPRTGGASPPDSYRLDPGEAFRLIVLDVRGRRVVLIIDSFGLPAEQFPAFLRGAASKLLKSLQFPG
jgi:hypothetical protein